MMKNPTSVSKKKLNRFKSALLLTKGISNKTGGLADFIALKIKKKMMELQRFEFLLKIVTKKTGTIDPDMKSEMRTKNYP